MLVVRDRSPARLDAMLAAARSRDVTYAFAGATLRGERPAGYHHDTRRLVLGSGPETFRRSVEGLRRWAAHRGAGAEVHPAVAPLEEGGTVLVLLPVAGVAAVAPCRIVRVVDEPGRFGFAYGTLPGHPEDGEESFVVTIGEGGTVDFAVTVLSRPADRLAKLGAPVAAAIQQWMIGRYLRGLAAAT
ncbi:MAG TPA: DUF1990 domain-containing protein [Acidimicrobiales bacterium]|nr:DUF1990 domain-containing protein [Acidimicrobiales bacterium]